MVEFDAYGFKKSDEKFKRNRNAEDIRYRKVQLVTFEKRLIQTLPQDCELCFHGTPIWNAEQIIKSGNISALIDRIGEKENVLPNPGKISVSTIKNLWFTIKYHTELYNYDYPAGCIFVIMPNGKDEIKSSQEENIINNVYFEKHPQRLKAIITTPENIDLVKQWIAQSELNIDTDVVVDFERFIINMKDKYQQETSKTI